VAYFKALTLPSCGGQYIRKSMEIPGFTSGVPTDITAGQNNVTFWPTRSVL